MSTQRMAGMTMLLLILTVCVAHAEDGLTGTYRATGTKGEIVLTLQQNEQGGASGTLRGGELSLQLNGLPRADGGIIGRATTQTGEFASYFAVVRQDGQLLFMLIPANANGDPDLERASQFPFPIGDNAPAAVPLAGAPLAGAAGDFSGSFSGDGL